MNRQGLVVLSCLAAGAEIRCSTQVPDFLNWCPADRTGLAFSSPVEYPPVFPRVVVQVALIIPAAQIPRLSQGFPDCLIQRSPFPLGDIDGPPPRMDPGLEEDVLQVAVANPPDARLANHKELDASRVFFRKLSEKPLKVFKGERIAQGRDSLFTKMRVGSDFRLVKKLDRTLSLHRDRQVSVILKVEQELVSLGQSVLASVEQYPLSASPKYEYVVWLHASQDPGAVFFGWAYRLTVENSLVLF